MTFKAPVLREIVDPEPIWPVPNREVGCMDVVGSVRDEGMNGFDHPQALAWQCRRGYLGYFIAAYST